MRLSSRSLSKPEIVRSAGCVTCAARPGQPCIFSRAEDPRNLRAQAGQVHPKRKRQAERNLSLNVSVTQELDRLLQTINL